MSSYLPARLARSSVGSTPHRTSSAPRRWGANTPWKGFCRTQKGIPPRWGRLLTPACRISPPLGRCSARRRRQSPLVRAPSAARRTHPDRDRSDLCGVQTSPPGWRGTALQHAAGARDTREALCEDARGSSAAGRGSHRPLHRDLRGKLGAAREESLSVDNGVAKPLVRGLLASLGKSAEHEHSFRDLQVNEEGRPTKTPPASPA